MAREATGAPDAPERILHGGMDAGVLTLLVCQMQWDAGTRLLSHVMRQSATRFTHLVPAPALDPRSF